MRWLDDLRALYRAERLSVAFRVSTRLLKRASDARESGDERTARRAFLAAERVLVNAPACWQRDDLLKDLRTFLKQDRAQCN